MPHQMAYGIGDTSGKCHVGQGIHKANAIWDRKYLRQMTDRTGDISG